MKNIKSKLLTLAVVVTALVGLGFSSTAFASPVHPPVLITMTATDSKASACAALQQLDATKKCDGTDTGVTNLVKSIVSLLGWVVGIVAVVMVIIGAFKYVTSSGDPNNVSSAKNTLLYAMIGLFIAALAQFLVHFVISTAK